MVEQDVEERFVGAEALDRTEVPVGQVRHVYVDDETRQPMWAGVRVPILDSEVLVPLDGAEWDDEALHLAVGGAAILGAPRTADVVGLSEREQERLLTHYGIPTVRHPRSADVLLGVDCADVCYALHDAR